MCSSHSCPDPPPSSLRHGGAPGLRALFLPGCPTPYPPSPLSPLLSQPARRRLGTHSANKCTWYISSAPYMRMHRPSLLSRPPRTRPRFDSITSCPKESAPLATRTPPPQSVSRAWLHHARSCHSTPCTPPRSSRPLCPPPESHPSLVPFPLGPGARSDE